MKLSWTYAFAEIIIMILGITIAFGLKNYAEKLKNNRQEQTCLLNLKADFQQDLENLQQNLSVIRDQSLAVEALLPHAGATLPGRDTVFFKAFQIAESPVFVPTLVTHNTMIHSGDYKLISDFELRTQLERTYKKYQALEREHIRSDNFSKTYFGDFFVRELDYKALSRGDYSFMDHPILHNLLRSKSGILNELARVTGETATQVQSMIDTLSEATGEK